MFWTVVYGKNRLIFIIYNKDQRVYTVILKLLCIEEVEGMSDQNIQEKEQGHYNKHQRFDQLMFGSRRDQAADQKEDQPTEPLLKESDNNKASTTTQGEFDLFQMLQSVDELMGNVKQFKPMVQQLAPLLDLFKQKK
jgi:hypothetical protein